MERGRTDRLCFLKEFDVAAQEICVDLLRLSFPAGKSFTSSFLILPDSYVSAVFFDFIYDPQKLTCFKQCKEETEETISVLVVFKRALIKDCISITNYGKHDF